MATSLNTSPSRAPASAPADRRYGLVSAALLSLIAALLSVDYLRPAADDLHIGDIAPREVRASRAVEFVDEDATQERRTQAATAVRPVFDYDPTVLRELDQSIRATFEGIRQALPPAEAAADARATPPSPEVVEQLYRRFDESLGVSLPTEAHRTLREARYNVAVEQALRTAIKEALGGLVIAEEDLLPRDREEAGISIRRLEGDTPRERLEQGDLDIVDLDQARVMVERTVRKQLADQTRVEVEAVVSLAQQLLKANLSFNAAETQARRIKARQAVSPVTSVIKKGAVVVRAGDPVDAQRLKALGALKRAQEEYHGGALVAALTGWGMLVLMVLYGFSSRFVRKFSPSQRDLLVLVVLMVFLMAAVRLGSELVHALAASGLPAEISAGLWPMLPVAAGAILVRVLLNAETALFFALAASIFCAQVLDRSLASAVFFLVTGLAGAGGLAHTRERLRILQAGVTSGVAGAALVLAGTLAVVLSAPGAGSDVDPMLLFVAMVSALLGGCLSAMLVLGLLPLFELLGYVTDNKLLELANLNHPLLKEMMVQAPGSYHHSVIVGSLSEAACEAIGANALLARVGCLYHDVGKMKKAAWFIENQRNQENRHDHVAPSMSALIIASHVREGIELARRHRLPQSLIDLIPQHHGTALISFFYNKAKQLEDPELGPVDENDYRYPGPRPQTREAGVVMIADAVEASTRSIKQPTAAKIRTNIQKVMSRVLSDGQLDECPLTLRDLNTISETFLEVLLGIYHSRIEYPADAPRPSAEIIELPQLAQRQAASAGRATGGRRDDPTVTTTLEMPPLALPRREGEGA